MANTKISQLPAATTLTTGDLLPVVQSGATKQVTLDLLPISTAAAAALAGKDAAGAAAAAQAVAVQRANHTGTQSADTITDGTTNKAYTGTERTKLAGIAVGATVNRADTATDAAITAAVNGLVNAAPGALDTLGELATQLQADESAAAALTTLVGQKAPLASPAFTGTPTIGGTAVAKTTDITTAVAGLITYVDNSDGTATVTGPGIVDNGNGTVTFTSTAGSTVPKLLAPTGDTTGTADTTAINTALTNYRRVILAPGDWYVSAVGLTTSDRWLQGSGMGTILHAVSGATGLTITGPGRIVVSDLTFDAGDYGMVVNGAYDADFRNLLFTNQVRGGIKVNGDLATEQHYTDVVMRGVGGVGFALTRTTTAYTGSLYLDRVRLVQPPASATVGFQFTSSAGSPSLNICFMDQCVADNYTGDAMQMNNCAQVFVSNSWFAINGSAPAGSAAVRITSGFQQTWQGNYTYSGLNSPTVVLAGNLRGIDLGGGHVFDGTPTAPAIGLAAATTYSGFKLGAYQNYCGGGLTDTPGALTPPAASLPGTTAAHGEETFSRLFCNDATAALPTGTLILSYFTATKTEVISTIEAMTSNAQTGGTYRGYGLYTVAADGTLTLVAKAEQSGTGTLWQSAFQPVGGFDTKLGLTATYTKTAGQRYAVGALFVGTTGPQLIAARPSNGTPGSNMPVTGTTLGQLAASRTGQSTLGTVGTTTHTPAQLTGYGWMPYFVLN